MSDCIFCKIINNEIPSYTIYEDGDFKAILDIAPSNLGHCLIIPKAHCKNIFDLPEKEAGSIMSVAKKIAGAMESTLDLDGLNILQNNGEAAGQTVFHFHMHLIPRFKNDNIRVGWDTLSPTPTELTDVFDKLKGLI